MSKVYKGLEPVDTFYTYPPLHKQVNKPQQPAPPIRAQSFEVQRLKRELGLEK